MSEVAILQGFCLQHQDDVEIGVDRRCLTDGSLTIAPSTACSHVRWEDGAWGACHAPEESLTGQAKPCKPVAAGTWRNVLAQQQKAVAKRERDRVTTGKAMCQHGRLRTDRTLAAFPSHEGAPKLATARKPALRVKRTPPRYCRSCGAVFRANPEDQERRHCSAPCETARYDVGQTVRGLTVLPCPVCATPFVPYIAGGSVPRVTCSQRCGARFGGMKQRSHRWSERYEGCTDPEHIGDRTRIPHRAHGICESCTRRRRNRAKRTVAA